MRWHGHTFVLLLIGFSCLHAAYGAPDPTRALARQAEKLEERLKQAAFSFWSTENDSMRPEVSALRMNFRELMGKARSLSLAFCRPEVDPGRQSAKVRSAVADLDEQIRLVDHSLGYWRSANRAYGFPVRREFEEAWAEALAFHKKFRSHPSLAAPAPERSGHRRGPR